MRKIVLSLCCLLLVAMSTLSLAAAPKAVYKTQTYSGVQMNMGKIGVYTTDIFIINNTPDSLYVTSPTAVNDYLAPKGVYRLFSDSSISPQVIIWHKYAGNFYNRYTAPHSIISVALYNGSINTITVEYN